MDKMSDVLLIKHLKASDRKLNEYAVVSINFDAFVILEQRREEERKRQIIVEK